MRHFTWLTLTFLLLMGPAAHAGDITGTVHFEGKAPKMRPIDISSDAACCASAGSDETLNETLVLGQGQTMGNVFVEVVNVPEGDYEVPEEPLVLTQKGCRYSPRVFGIRAGQPLEIHNPDGTVHNVNGQPEENPAFNVGMPKELERYTVTLQKPEPIFPIRCDVHPWMKAYCAVMDHPFFGVTDESGIFVIKDLPPGEYEVRAWHEKLGTRTAMVTVRDDKAVVQDFTFAR